ncbi:MAG: A24 family peptidase [Christensenellaceae bacterium]
MHAHGIAPAVLFSCLLLAASLWDIRKRIIPDSICLAIAVVGLLTFRPVKLFGMLLGLPFLIAALIKECGMGGGDINLVVACGLVLGFSTGSVGFVIGLLAALMWHIITRVVHKREQGSVETRKTSSLPLAPFLSIGFMVAYTTLQ